ncbi:hypothetical protein MKX01_039383 [Papaver californicum]|nr:hypothetical protein MKX01_039383 [Papaver californicum]
MVYVMKNRVKFGDNFTPKVEIIREVVTESMPIDDNIRCPPVSNPKGRHKKKRIKGGKELAKQKKTCGYCNQFGHYVTTCLTKKADEERRGLVKPYLMWRPRVMGRTRKRRLAKTWI